MIPPSFLQPLLLLLLLLGRGGREGGGGRAGEGGGEEGLKGRGWRRMVSHPTGPKITTTT